MFLKLLLKSNHQSNFFHTCESCCYDVHISMLLNIFTSFWNWRVLVQTSYVVKQILKFRRKILCNGERLRK